MDKILFTIITVCYQAEKEIENTIRSVLSQDSTNYEYLIVDGASTDKTMKIVERYRKAFRKKGISYRVISEKDTGNYCAMNKGIDMAEGEYLNFMNAGDCFATSHVLTEIGNLSQIGKYDVIYGDTILTQFGCYKKAPGRSVEVMVVDIPFCHQSTFTKAQVMKKYHFDEHFRVCADHNFFATVYDENKSAFYYTPYPISIFALGGLSTTARFTLKREQAEIQKKLGYIDDQKYQERLVSIAEEERIQNTPAASPKGIYGLYCRLMPKCFRTLRYFSVQRKAHLSNGWVARSDKV